MWRTALRPRWLALLALVLVAATAMAWLGNWQLGRAREQGRSAQEERAAQPAVPLESLISAHSRFPSQASERQVIVRGSWEPDGQLVVRDRVQGDVHGAWVLTPVRLADGTAIGVVRGFTADPGATTPAPTGEVTVTGLLRPGEPGVVRAPGAASGLPPGQIDRIDPVELIERWPGRLFTGYVVASAAPAVQAGLTPVPQVSDRSSLALQNLSYALQWWLFAGFGLWMWWRLVRDDHRSEISDADARMGA